MCIPFDSGSGKKKKEIIKQENKNYTKEKKRARSGEKEGRRDLPCTISAVSFAMAGQP